MRGAQSAHGARVGILLAARAAGRQRTSLRLEPGLLDMELLDFRCPLACPFACPFGC